MSKLFKSKSIDADINVDWKKHTVSFKNEKKPKFLSKSSLIMGLFYAILISSVFLYTNYTSDERILELTSKDAQIVIDEMIADFPIYSPFEIILYGVLAFSFPVIALNSTLIPMYSERVRKFIVNRRVKNGTFYSYSIPNPSGLIKLDVHGSDPIVDLEFSNEISESIESVDLVKVPIGKKNKKRIQLHILLSNPAKGELKITEYF